jgi:HK97 family phage major capsid protein
MNTNELELKKRQMRHQLKQMRTEDIPIMSNRRNEMRRLLQVKEVREFYDKLQMVLRGQAITGNLEIPELVEDRIKELLSTYSGLYDEVQVVPIGIEGRAIISVGEPEAKWDEIKTTLEELETSFELLEMEDIRVGGYLLTGNSTIKDSIIGMALYLEELLVKALAYGLDDGIINGRGDYTAVFEPVGILMDLPDENDVTAPFTAEDILSKIELIDTENKQDIGEVVAVMKRKTYYKDILAISNSALPYPNIKGLRVKFSGAVADDEIILGDFKEYILGERNNGMRIEKSSDGSLFITEQTLLRIVGRYDGKPYNEKAFVRITKQSEEDAS